MTAGGKKRRTRRRTRVLLAGALVLALCAAAYHFGPWIFKRAQSLGMERNVVIIVVDTLRADKLECYGGWQGLTPNIDGLARTSVVFENAYAHAPWTLPSMASLYTSQLPVQHGAGGRLGKFKMLDVRVPTLAELLRDGGADTAAITNVLFLGQRFGMTRGFESVDEALSRDNSTGRRAGETTAAAIRWLEEHSFGRFFLLVHYFDPHLTYDPPEPFRKRFAGDVPDGEPFGTTQDMVALRKGEIELNPETIRGLEKLYNAEVAYTDAQVGKLLDHLEKSGLMDDTVVVILSDHGEEFLDHDGFEHGHTLHEELLRVPLIIWSPDGETARVKTVVRLIDVAPTVCDMAGIDAPDSFWGRSLVSLIKSGGKDRPLLAQSTMWGPEIHAWRDGRHKIILDPVTGGEQLFDVVSDPGEKEDVSREMEGTCLRMGGQARAMIRSLGGGKEAWTELSKEEIEMLRALGYVE